MPLSFQAQGNGVRVPGLRLGGNWVLKPSFRAYIGTVHRPCSDGESDEEVEPGWEGARTVEGWGLLSSRLPNLQV